MNDISVTANVDVKQIKKAQKLLDKFARTLEKANSLADELANKEIRIDVIFQQKSLRRSIGRRFLQRLHGFLFHNSDR